MKDIPVIEPKEIIEEIYNLRTGEKYNNDEEWKAKGIPESEIRKVSRSDRAYQAREEIGVKPTIWYQLKVRNIEDDLAMNAVSKESHSEHH